LAGVSHGTEAQLCHERNMVHCVVGRQTRLQQYYKSLAAVPAWATVLDNAAC